MVSIPGWAYIIIGVGISWYSWFVNKATYGSGGNPVMKVFFWLGVLFIFIGVAKIAAARFLRKTDPGESALSNTLAPRQPIRQQSVVLCPYCKGKTYGHGNFCHRCGGRLR
ncbi:hypothetical protein CMO92_03530 [Candidatus Woesearchaeota archaeon]|mgnify:CR=1 FL=1|nr:hypothetical protein [Candidatus Woesearchaeota archaeon]|tara:strand:+ start:535 stop:867 length:333 start_codon:yes stop_codon:yes gene_type:complete